VTDYRRELDLDSAVARVTYRQGETGFTREVFANPVDQCIVVRLSASGGYKPGMITFDVELTRPADYNVTTVEPAGIIMTGQAGHQGQHKGVKFEARLHVVPQGGVIKVTKTGLRVEDANAATVLVVAGTNYRGDNPTELCEQLLKSVAQKDYSQLIQAHLAEHRRLFRRVELDLGRTDVSLLPTDVRLKAVQAGADDPDLCALYFQYGRYLLMSCSRPGDMPANLQGLWNQHISAPWSCDYHININIQMNYWPAELCNLSECHEPFFDLVDNLRPQGRQTAKDVYDCNGFVAHYTTDAWWWTSPVGNVRYSLWPTGAAWCCQHLWEHYAFSGDREFLEKRAYPIMKEAAEFFLDFLVEHPKTGELVCGPSISPENRFRTSDGQVANVTMGPAMDQQIIYDLFSNCVEAAEVLGINDSFTQKVKTYRAKLAGPKIGHDGRLMEWNEEFEEPEPGHRHISHLFALHPGRQITVTGTPELAQAARKSLEYRLAHGGGHTGWSRAWIINFWARLRDGEKAHENVLALLQKSTLFNLFDNHPPFQIDGNFGGAAGIAEMLLQSQTPSTSSEQAGEIHLLPALPEAWPTGHVKGLRARGGYEVSIRWQGGKLTEVQIKSTIGGKCEVRYEDKVAPIETEKGKAYTLTGSLSPM
jgi:alpha-L-fucosidase 2